MEYKNKKIFHAVLLFSIIALAFTLRFYKIETIPAGVYPDEAVNAIDAITANETGHYKLFYTNNYGREGLFMNLIALSFKFLGVTILSLRAWSILFGTLTVLGLFLISKEFFRSPRAGLITAYLGATSFWAINFSRISFRAIMLPFVLTYAFYFLLRGLRLKSYLPFILAGIFFGLGMHTYIAFRVAPLILVVMLPVFIIAKKGFLREYWKHIAVFSIAVLLIASPMFYDFIINPDHFSSRSNSISVFSPEINHGNLMGTFLKSFGLSLIKYNFWGDQNWRHNFPPYPVLDPIVGIAFLAGFIYLIAKIFQLSVLRFKYKMHDDKLALYLFLIVWFFVMLAPEFLTAEGLPHALRSIGTIPVVLIIATIPFLWILGKSEQAGVFFKVIVLSLFALIFAAVGIFNATKYLVFWAHKPEQHANFNENFKNMGLYLNSLPASLNKYVITNGGGKMIEDGLPVTAEPVRLITYRKVQNMQFVKKEDLGQLKLANPAVVVLMGYDQNVINQMKSAFPNAQNQKIDLDPGYQSDFTIINIP